MALAQVIVNPFDDQQALLSKYWYERLQYTAGPLALPAGLETPIFALQQGNPDQTTPEWRTHLVRPAGSQNAGVYYTLKADKAVRYGGSVELGNTAAFRAGYRPDEHFDVPAIGSMSFSLTNATTGNITGHHLNFQVVRNRMTVAEKLFLGLGKGSLTPDELDALNYATPAGQADVPTAASERPFNIETALTQGKQPIPWYAQIERRIESRVVRKEPVYVYVPGVGAATPTPIGNPVTALSSEDEVLVLRTIGIENDPLTGAPPNAKLAVNRDVGTYNYMGLNLNEYLQSDDAPWDVFMPARDSISFYAQAYAGTVNILLRAEVLHVRRSDIIDAWWGLRTARQMPKRTFYGAIAGVAA